MIKVRQLSKILIILHYLTILIFTLIVSVYFVSCDNDGDGSNDTLDLAVTEATTTQIVDEEGNPQNRSVLRINFNGEVQVLDASGLTVKSALRDPVTDQTVFSELDIEQTNVTGVIVNTVKATTRQVDNNTLELTVDGLVGDGGIFSVTDGVLTINGNPIEAGEITLSLPTSPEEATLAIKPFSPTDINLFLQLAYPDGMLDIIPPPLIDEKVFEGFSEFMQRKVDLGLISEEELQELLELFNSPEVIETIPNANLRAALLSLAGTACSAAIDAVINGENRRGIPYALVDFDLGKVNLPSPLEVFPPILALSFPNTPGGSTVIFNDALMGEPFQAISAVMAHEVLHQGVVSSGIPEEIVAAAAGTLVWAQQLLIDPQVVSTNTFTLDFENSALLGMLNSGKRGFPNLGLDEAPQMHSPPVALPDAVSPFGELTSFEDGFRFINELGGIADTDTPGQNNPTLQSYLSAISQSNQSGWDFNQETLDFIDGNIRIFTPQEQFKLVQILKLRLPEGIIP